MEILSSVDTYNLLSAPEICNIITKQEYSRWGLTQIYCLYSYHVYVRFAWGECTDKIIMKYTMCETDSVTYSNLINGNIFYCDICNESS